MNFEKGSGNVYRDLGTPDAKKMYIKAQLVSKIGEMIKLRGWTQQKAAEILGMTQPKLSKMLAGQFRGISETKLLHCLARLGNKVQIIVGPASESTGSIEVVFSI